MSFFLHSPYHTYPQLNLNQVLVEVWWLDMFWQSTHVLFCAPTVQRDDSIHLGLFTSWGAFSPARLPSCKQRMAGIFGLSKERPILGNHAKTHICGFHMKFGGFHMKFGGFHKIWQISWNPLAKLINQINWKKKTLQFYAVQWEGYVSGFHEICRISCEIRQISKD